MINKIARESELDSSEFKHKKFSELGYNRKSGLIQEFEEDNPELHLNSIVEITLNKPKILIKDRPHFEEAIILQTDYIKMTNGIDFATGRWFEMPEKQTIESKFNIFIKNLSLSYANTTTISNIFDMEISVSNLVKTPLIESIPHSIINKAGKTTITVNHMLKLMLTQSIYSYFLR